MMQQDIGGRTKSLARLVLGGISIVGVGAVTILAVGVILAIRNPDVSPITGAGAPPEVSASPPESTSPSESPLAESATPSGDNETRDQFLAGTPFVTVGDDGGWLLGRSGRPPIALPLTVLDLDNVRIDFGRATAFDFDGADWVFSSVDLKSGELTELYRRPGYRAEIQATVNRSGTKLYIQVGSPGIDGDNGISVVAIRTGEATVLIQPDADGVSSRNVLEWSWTGRTLASSLCEREVPCVVDVIDAATDTVRRLPSKLFLSDVSDDVVVGVERVSGPWVATVLNTGETFTVGSGIANRDRARSIAGGQFLVSGYSADGSKHLTYVIDPGRRSEKLVLTQPGSDPDPAVIVDYGRSPRWAVLAHIRHGIYAPITGRLDLLDLATGEVTTFGDTVP